VKLAETEGFEPSIRL